MSGKISGLGDNFWLSGYDLSGDANSFEISSPLAVDEVPGITVRAQERIGLGRDSAINWTSYWNVDVGHAHPVLSALPMTDRVATYAVGTTLGNPAASHVCKQINYDPNRADNGSMRAAVATQGNGYGLEWGLQLTAGKRTDTAATNGASIDTAASLAFGAQAYLQAFSLTGTDVTVKIQDSADNSNWLDVAAFAFTQVTSAPTSQRIALANTATVRRYLRAITTTATSFSSFTFSVMVVKNKLAGQAF